MILAENELAKTLSLDGTWDFSLGDQSGQIMVPGSWEARGYDRDLTGPAVYCKRVHIPADWQGCAVQLQFDAISYVSQVAVNGIDLGEERGTWTPHVFDLTDAIRPGEDNEIVLTVHKPGGPEHPLRETLSGFLPDVMMMFGGVWQSARLVALPGSWIDKVRVKPDVTGLVEIYAEAQEADSMNASICIIGPDQCIAAECSISSFSCVIEAQLTIDDPQQWSSENPAIYTAEITLEKDGIVHARVTRKFGFRALSADGNQLLFNGEPVSLRGVLNWGWYPEILCPAPDEATIRDEFRRVRAMGFNMVKLCLVVPDPLYFEIADEEGMFLWLELPLWLPENLDTHWRQIHNEYGKIIRSVNHHPSIVIYSLGCELDDSIGAKLLKSLDDIVRSYTKGTLHCDNSGSGEAYGGLTDYADFNDYHFYSDLQYFEPLVKHFQRSWRDRPWIFGEFCDADDYRDLEAVAEAHDGELPWWLTTWNPIHPPEKIAYPAQRERMAALDLDVSDKELVTLSRKQSFVIRKYTLEKVRSHAGMGGYVITSLRDTPVASSAIFDDLGQPKYDAEAFQQFNADSVLLIERSRARSWTHGGDRPSPLDPYCFEAGQPITYDLIGSWSHPDEMWLEYYWYVKDASKQRVTGHNGNLAGHRISSKNHSPIKISFDAPQTHIPQQYKLWAELSSYVDVLDNEWPIWVFPAIKAWPDDVVCYDPIRALDRLDDFYQTARRDMIDPDVAVVVTNVLDDAVQDYLAGGGNVILLQSGDYPLPFWRESLKIIDDQHPVMSAFPHDGFVDMQFYSLATDRAFVLGQIADVLPAMTDIQYGLRRLDARLFTMSEYLFTARVGAGHITATTLRLQGGLGDQPVGLRNSPAARWLLQSMIDDLKKRD